MTAAERGALEFRPVDPMDDAALTAWFASTALVFLAAPDYLPSPELVAFRRPVLAGQRLTGAFDGDRLVATYRSWDWGLTVPGGATVTADAISSVTVLPTHRRRGALTHLMTSDLRRARDAGVPAAVLVASEAAIYGRYGFGPATRGTLWEVDTRAARLHPGAPDGGTVEITDAVTLRREAPGVFAAARRAGETERTPAWWDVTCGITPWPGASPQGRGLVLYRDPAGAAQGYMIYGWQTSPDPGRVPNGTIDVHELRAATPQAYAGLWRYLIGIDLVTTIRASHRPPDEPLPALLTDARAARCATTVDLLWARVLDPAAALTARRYETPGHAVLEITDPLGLASGVIELQVAADGTAQAHTPPGPRPGQALAPDLTLPVSVLSSVWLGGGDLPAAAMAGLVTEHRPGAVADITRLFRTVTAPWTDTIF